LRHYYHDAAEAQMKFAPAIREHDKAALAGKFGRARLAQLLGVREEVGCLTFMSSRTASGWSLIERFGSAEQLGVTLTLGASAGILGVWNGVMLFTRGRANERFDASSLVVPARNQTVHALLRRREQRTRDNVSLAVAAICGELFALVRRRRGDRVQPSMLNVVLAGGDAAALSADRDAIASALGALAVERQVSVNVVVAQRPLYNDLRGLLSFHRLCGSSAELQQWVDQPTRVSQARLHFADIASDAVLLANVGGMLSAELERWLLQQLFEISRRPFVVRHEQSFVALRALLLDKSSHGDFLKALAAQESFGDSGVRLDRHLARHYGDFRANQNDNCAALSAHELFCDWLVEHWHTIAVTLIQLRAEAALKRLVTLVMLSGDSRRALRERLNKLRYALMDLSCAEEELE